MALFFDWDANNNFMLSTKVGELVYKPPQHIAYTDSWGIVGFDFKFPTAENQVPSLRVQ